MVGIFFGDDNINFTGRLNIIESNQTKNYCEVGSKTV